VSLIAPQKAIAPEEPVEYEAQPPKVLHFDAAK
jgi:hypothetical protein